MNVIFRAVRVTFSLALLTILSFVQISRANAEPAKFQVALTCTSAELTSVARPVPTIQLIVLSQGDTLQSAQAAFASTDFGTAKVSYEVGKFYFGSTVFADLAENSNFNKVSRLKIAIQKHLGVEQATFEYFSPFTNAEESAILSCVRL